MRKSLRAAGLLSFGLGATLALAQSYPEMRREDIIETIRRPARKIGRSVGDLVGNRPHWNARDLTRAGHKLQRWEQDRLKDYLDDVERRGKHRIDVAVTLTNDSGLGAMAR